MQTLLIVLTVIVSVLLIGVVLIQKSKGGGLASNFAGSNQIMGVRRTNNFIEKATWTLAIVILFLSIMSSMVSPNLPGAKYDNIGAQQQEQTAPTEFQGNIFGLINQRRGVIVDSTDENNTSTVNAEVPLSEMFGFSTILRSSTQGKGEFTMEFLKYGKVPYTIADELIAKYKAEKEAAKK